MLLRALMTFPRARRWVQQSIHQSRSIAQPMASMGFDRLGRWFSPRLLDQVRVVVAERTPRLPLEDWGFPEGHDLTPTNPAGLTLGDVVFIKRGCERDESLMFHELVHVVQWRGLGLGPFIAFYGLELIERGYAEHRLEIMVRDLQAAFDAGAAPFDAQAEAARRTRKAAREFGRDHWHHRLAMALARVFA